MLANPVCSRPSCYGRLIRDEYGDFVCLWCSRSTAEISDLPYVPSYLLVTPGPADAPQALAARNLVELDPATVARDHIRELNAASAMRYRDRVAARRKAG